jgi:hypothetical protein
MPRVEKSSLGLIGNACAVALALVAASPLCEAAPVPVRFVEGATHGFLTIRPPDKKPVGTGELLQVARGHAVESRMVLRFNDGSVYDETVVFSQQRVFTLSSYRLIQRGPAFPEELEASVDREKGTYAVRRRRGGSSDEASGTIDLPQDLYNGMAVLILRNLPKGAAETVHVLSFTPKPVLVQLELRPAGEDPVVAGPRTLTAAHFVLAPKLGAIRRLGAVMLGKSPSSYHCWMLMADVPAFVRLEGSLYPGGPVLWIEPVSPEGPVRPRASG